MAFGVRYVWAVASGGPCAWLRAPWGSARVCVAMRLEGERVVVNYNFVRVVDVYVCLEHSTHRCRFGMECVLSSLIRHSVR